MAATLVLVAVLASSIEVRADSIVAKVTGAPIFANGIVRDVRSGINIFLQREESAGDTFLDPAIIGYGIPAGGRIEVEMISGYQRDPEVPLDRHALILVTGTPQQGLPAQKTGLEITEGSNPYTFVIRAKGGEELIGDKLLSPARAASKDPIRQRGIKIIHIGRASAFVSRGEKGIVEVRIYDGEEQVIGFGRGEVEFLAEPRPQIYPTNIPHEQRNHNWQRVGTGKILGVATNTLPMPLLLFERNEGLDNQGIFDVGVLSSAQLAELKYEVPDALAGFTDGLILKDSDGNGFLHPSIDTIIGGFSIETPTGAQGYQVLTPLVSEKPFLSAGTERYNERAGASIGGAIMQVVFIAGNVPGLYEPTFSLLTVPGDFSSGIGSSATYTIVVEQSDD
ncbi:MAG: hypothetical protein AAF478_09945 [Pseudomonadota bacterium]